MDTRMTLYIKYIRRLSKTTNPATLRKIQRDAERDKNGFTERQWVKLRFILYAIKKAIGTFRT